jgi:diguanylate cyclase (GGDEF)-like protein
VQEREWDRSGRGLHVVAPLPDVPRTASVVLDHITAALANRPGVETAVMATAGPGGRVEILSAAGPHIREAPRPPDFVARAIAAGRPLVEACEASAPLVLGDGPAAALCVTFRGPWPAAGEGVLWVLESYARLASLTLTGDGLVGSLLAAVRRDQLTGCVNYATLLEELNREVERCRRHDLTLACCFLDLDRYKAVNDHLGHDYGNRVLARVGVVLRETVRAADTVGRYGGDEFVVLLPGSDGQAAARLAERMRAAIRMIPVAGVPDGLDVSTGIAEWHRESGPDRLLGESDAALRSAKAAGGGTAVIFAAAKQAEPG